MAKVSLIIRIKKGDDVPLEIEDDETVEALGVVIFSIRPELGEDFKLLRNGKVLKPELVLSEIGVKNDDVILVAKVAPKKETSTGEASFEKTLSDATSTSTIQAKFDPPPRADGDLSSSPPLKCARLEEGSMGAETAVKTEQTPAVSENVVPPTAPSPVVELHVPKASDPEPIPSPAEEPATNFDLPTDEHPSAIVESHEKPVSEESVKQEPAVSQVEVDATTSAGLLAFAASLENGSLAPPPAKLAELMREAASRMVALESTAKEFGQALQMVNIISATGLRGGMSDLGESSPKAEDSGRSFLIKKGDADLQELHQKATSPMCRTTSGTTGGGALSSASMSKEEMDKARQARLAKLEAMQAEKQKEKDEADEKSRARDAMFSRRGDPAPPKPFSGKH